jgi:hypothetical protein
MTVSIATHESGPYPRLITVTLSCDAATDIFCRGFADFTSRDGYIGAHSQAMAAGWLERQTSQGRLWLCPRCSGKG